MTKEELISLLEYCEQTWIDWKMDFPPELLKKSGDPEWEKGKGNLLKDLVSIANGIENKEGFLVYGVEDLQTHRVIKGISKFWDDADFQIWVEKSLDPPILFQYSELEWEQKIRVGIFRVGISKNYPHVVCKNIGGVIYEGQVWFRRGSKNSVAFHNELKEMFRNSEPIVIRDENSPIFQEAKEYYESQGYEICLPEGIYKSDYEARGFTIVYKPNTRKEIWYGYDPRTGKPEHILMLRPK